MAIKVVADSSLDLNNKLEETYGLTVDLVPFKLYIDEVEYADDEKLDVYSFIDQMVKSPVVPRSACPSPMDFYNSLSKEDDNYIVTISSKLSGTYNSAVLAKNMFIEEFKDKFVHVFDSKSASIGETLVSLKIFELHNKGLVREELVNQVEKYISEMRTFFVSESLDNLMKNGRISRLKGTIAAVFKIKPIMGTNDLGEIILYEKARGSDRAFERMAEMIVENAGNAKEKILAISHVNNEAMAVRLKQLVNDKTNFKDIVIVQTGGLSSLYCDNKGIIVAF